MPQASLNFITAHDGFTLRDLVSYRHKHNERNGEGNRDGHDRNYAWNCGCEGPSNAPSVRLLRRSLQRALLATLCIAQGVPMLQGGDELGRTQAGNNNAYCQDNELTWLDWAQADSSLIEFVSGLIALRRNFPQLRRRTWLTGEAQNDGSRDSVWWHPAGCEMRVADWESSVLDTFGLQLAPVTTKGREQSLLCLFNRSGYPVVFHLPRGNWRQLCDSSAENPFAQVACWSRSSLAPHSVKILSLE